jgi:hypothetical protein
VGAAQVAQDGAGRVLAGRSAQWALSSVSGGLMAERKTLDWEGIEQAYRIGIDTLRAIGEQFGCSHTAIQKRAEKYGWTRDLSAKIAAEAAALVAKQSVASEVSKERLATEKQIIAGNAQAAANIALSHRADIKLLRMRAAEYETELAECEDELSKRVSILKMLSETQAKLITAEREAFGMGKGDMADDEPIKSIVRRIIG